MTAPPTDLPALRSLLWASQSVYAAELLPDGMVVGANAAIGARAGYELAGTPFGELLAAPQRPALLAALDGAADDEWTSLVLTFAGGAGRQPEDRAVRLRRTGSRVLLVAEPAHAERDHLVEQVLALNDELVTAQRALGRRQRELERSRQEAQAASRRANQLEAITLAGLTRSDTDDALAALLEVARSLIGSDGATLLLREEERGTLLVRAAVGTTAEFTAPGRVALGEGITGRIAQTGVAEIVDDLTQSTTVNPELKARGGSLAGVPLTVDGEVIGVLHVLSLDRASFVAGDLRLLELVGQRVSLAVGHAQLRERERRISETLQRSLLPDRLPAVPGLTLVARYRPQVHSVHVGGDFYDATVLSDATVSLAIGDVAGKGLRAAALMGQLRSSLRAYALEGHGPAAVLERLDRLVVEAEDFATGLHLLLDPATGAATFASAGHPPPLRRPAGGPAEYVAHRSAAPLGLGLGGRTATPVALAPGDLLVLYTDGLFERRGEDPDVRLAALRAAVDAGPADDLDALCDHLLAELTAAAGFGDDVALLAVRRDG